MQKESEERFCIEDVKHLIYHRKEEIMYERMYISNMFKAIYIKIL